MKSQRFTLYFLFIYREKVLNLYVIQATLFELALWFDVVSDSLAKYFSIVTKRSIALDQPFSEP